MSHVRLAQRDDGFFVEMPRRLNVELVGTINGANMVFTVPASDKFLQDALHQIQPRYDGRDMFVGASNDYTVSESGGVGTGFDTVTFTFAPKVGDRLTADYDLDV